MWLVVQLGNCDLSDGIPDILIDIFFQLLWGAPTSMSDNLTLVVVGDGEVGKSALAVRVCHVFPL